MSDEVQATVERSTWAKLFRFAVSILLIGQLLGTIVYAFFGRELQNDELGVLLWPLAAFYLLCFFYAMSYLVFTAVKSPLRYFVIPLWILVLALFAVGIVIAIAERSP